MKATLHFSNNGEIAHIVFASGSESLDFESKQEARESISDCQKRQLITKAEAEEFIKQIEVAPNMPESERTVPFMVGFAMIAVPL